MFSETACERFGNIYPECQFHWTAVGVSLIFDTLVALVACAVSSYLAYLSYAAKDSPKEPNVNEITALAPKLTRLPPSSTVVDSMKSPWV